MTAALRTGGRPRIAVVGATGAVGGTILELISSRHLPYESVTAIASPRSAGQTVEFAGTQLPVHALDTFDFADIDIAFFSAGTGISTEFAPRAAAAGALVIDNTNAFRMDPDSPLIVPQVNGHLVLERPASGIIGNPNCSTIPLVRVLDALRGRWSPRKVIVSTYQAASGQGLRGLDELRAHTRRALESDDLDRYTAGRFPRSLAFDALPMIDVPLETGFTLEEQKMTQESIKILNDPSIEVTATCVRIPVMNCHSEAVYIESDAPFNVDEVAQVLAAGDEITVHRATESFPSPATIGSPGLDRDHVHVGRLRTVPGNPNALWLWLVADNIRIGAALNAIQIAERVPVSTAVAS